MDYGGEGFQGAHSWSMTMAREEGTLYSDVDTGRCVKREGE